MDSEATPSAGRLKAATFTAVFLIAVAAVGGLWQRHQHVREMAQLQTDAAARLLDTNRQASAVIAELASDIVLTLASTIADDVDRLDHAGVADAIATVVRGHRVLGVVVLEAGGSVFAATDQRFAGLSLDDPATRSALAATSVIVQPTPPGPGKVELAAPLVVDGDKVGAIRVFIELAPFVGLESEATR